MVFGCGSHFIVEKVEHLVNFVEPHGGFALLHLADEVESDARLERQLFLRHFVLFPQLFDGFSQQCFLHFLYPFGCKDNNSFLNYIRTDVFLLEFS